MRNKRREEIRVGIEQKILKICENLCCKKLSIDEQLIVTGLLDSFKIMELICGMEEEFSITFQPEEMTELENFSCVNNIISMVRDKIELF